MRASASRCNTLFPFIVSDVHHVVRFVSRLRTLPSRPRVQGEYRFRVEIWLGWVHGRRKESQDQFEVDRVFEWRLPFQSGRSGGVNDKNTRGEREREREREKGFGCGVKRNVHVLVGPWFIGS